MHVKSAPSDLHCASRLHSRSHSFFSGSQLAAPSAPPALQVAPIACSVQLASSLQLNVHTPQMQL
jgi:hypothetical protein